MTPAITYAMVNPRSGLLEQIMDQSEKQLTQADYPFVRIESVAIGGVGESVFFEHPPRNLTFRTKIRRLPAPAALGGRLRSIQPCTIPVPSAAERSRSHSAPFKTANKSHLHAGRSIRNASRQTVTGSRSVSISPRALGVSSTFTSKHRPWTRARAWALWGEPRFVPSSEHRVYQQHDMIFPLAFHEPGAYVFRIPNALPRLTIYHRAESVNSFKDALSAMTRPDFDVHHDIVVQGALPPLAPTSGADSVTITQMRSDETDASIVNGSAGLLMQNDSWYPGWKATVDGHDTPILHADGMFRGIPLAAGRHTVVIAYQSSTALAGQLLSIFGLIVLVVLVMDPIPRLRRRDRYLDKTEAYLRRSRFPQT